MKSQFHFFKPDPGAIAIAQKLQAFDENGTKVKSALRDAFDYAYDGQRTGRFSIDQLLKTEAANIGSLVEINLQRVLNGLLKDGNKMDYSISGIEVDCKYSKYPYGWMIPMESVGHYAMVVHANDNTSHWHLGIVKLNESILTEGRNRDMKRSITAAGRESIAWAWFQDDLPPNVFLQLPQKITSQILAHNSGQKRVDELFRLAQGKIITRTAIATAAQQEDYMKRVRYNGGARSRLQGEGIVILGGDFKKQKQLAKSLGLPIPKKGEMISARLSSNCTLQHKHTVQIEGKLWRLATTADPVEFAPRIDHVASAELRYTITNPLSLDMSFNITTHQLEDANMETRVNMMDTSLLDDLDPTIYYNPHTNQPQQNPPHPHHSETPNQHHNPHNHQPEL